MPGFLLHSGATVLCGHGGQASPTAPNPRVRVSGQPVTTQPTPYMVAACPLPPSSGGPCVSAQWTTGALRVRAGGQPLLLNSSAAICAPTGAPLNAVQTQTRVRGS